MHTEELIALLEQYCNERKNCDNCPFLIEMGSFNKYNLCCIDRITDGLKKENI